MQSLPCLGFRSGNTRLSRRERSRRSSLWIFAGRIPLHDDQDIRPEKDIPALLENLSKSSSNFEIPEIWQHRKKDGSIIDVEITSRRVSFAGKPAELVLVNDMTQQLR